MSVCMGFGDRRAHFCLCSLSPCSAAPPMPKVSLLEDQIRELQVQLTAERAKNEQLCMQLATHTPSQAAPDAHQHHHQQLASSRVEQEIHQLQRVNHEQAAELMRLRQLLSHAQPGAKVGRPGNHPTKSFHLPALEHHHLHAGVGPSQLRENPSSQLSVGQSMASFAKRSSKKLLM
eukprot:m.186769 g.186769  ORF g.186769 m.186769 type:complete len:176 (+) comp53567_c0_seq24:250-777(+)